VGQEQESDTAIQTSTRGTTRLLQHLATHSNTNPLAQHKSNSGKRGETMARQKWKTRSERQEKYGHLNSGKRRAGTRSSKGKRRHQNYLFDVE
jgi:hypothetical protein